MKICKYCKSYKDEVCTNPDSPEYSNELKGKDTCEEYSEVVGQLKKGNIKKKYIASFSYEEEGCIFVEAENITGAIEEAHDEIEKRGLGSKKCDTKKNILIKDCSTTAANSEGVK